jgi:exopolysaccharide biosynthesis polyprenyl glycosylphosphotransferase
MKVLMKNSSTMNDAIFEPSLRKSIQSASAVISRTWQWRLFIGMLIINDIVMTAFAFRLAYWVRFGTGLPIFQLDVIPDLYYYQNLVIILIPGWVAIFALFGLYNRHNLVGGTREYAKIFNATTLGMFAVIATSFLVTEFVLSRGWLLFSWTFVLVMIALGRFLLRRVVYALRYRGYFLSPALIVGANEEGNSLASQLIHWRTSGLYIVGFVDDKQSLGARVVGDVPVLGRIDEINWIIEKNDVEEIIISSSALTRDQIYHIFQEYGTHKDINVRMSSGLYEILTTGLQVSEFAYVPLVGINKVRMTGIDSFLKFMLDYAITLPGMLVAGPLFLFIALMIKLDSPGPAIHRRRVMGVNGTQFDAFKFRTMYVNGDEILKQRPDLLEELAQTHKLKDDPRITRVGKIIRKISLDELPQLFNVLRREMSLVGPRMISPPEMEMYAEYGMNLLTVKPGITGLWQVSGRSDVTYAERVRLDMYYIRNWSIWLDLQLLFQTIPAVLSRRGAY